MFIKRLDTFGSSILLCIFLPLAPLLMASIEKKLEYKEVVLTAALYPMSLFIQSRSKFLFSLGVLLVGLFAVGFAFVKNNPMIYDGAINCIWGVSIIHLLERIHLHLINKEPFLSFSEIV